MTDYQGILDEVRTQVRTLRARLEQMERLELLTHQRDHTLRLQACVLDRMAEGVLLTDDGGAILVANPAADAMLAQAPGQLVGRNVFLLLASSPDIEPETVTDRWSGELAFQKPDGATLLTFVQTTPLELDGQNFRVWVIEDLSLRRPL